MSLHLCPYRMIEVAKSMRLTLIRPPRVQDPKAGLQDTNKHKQATLVLPLVSYEQFGDRPKRRKMR